MKISELLSESYDEVIHTWMTTVTGFDIGQVNQDINNAIALSKNNPTIENIKKTTAELNQTLDAIHNTFNNDRYWQEASKFSKAKAHQLADELIELEHKIEQYLLNS